MKKLHIYLLIILAIAICFAGCVTNRNNVIFFDKSEVDKFGSNMDDALYNALEVNQSASADNGRYICQTAVQFEGIDFAKYVLSDIADNTFCGIEYEYVLRNDDNSGSYSALDLVNKIRVDMQKQYGDAVTHMGGSTEVRELSDIPDDDLTGVYQEYYWYPEQTDNCTVKLTLDAVTVPDPIINVSCKAHPDKESLGYDFDFGFVKHFGMGKTEVCEKLGIDIKKLTLSNTGIADISNVDYNETEFVHQLMFDKTNNDALYGGQYRCIVKSEDYRGSSISQLVNDIRADMIRIYGNPSTYPETNTAFEKFVPADDDELTGQYEEYWYVSGKVPCTISLKLDAMGNDMFTAITVSYKTGPDLYGYENPHKVCGTTKI